MSQRPFLGDRRATTVEPTPAAATDSVVGSVSATLTYAANASFAHAISNIVASFAGGTNTVATVIVKDGTTTVRTYYLDIGSEGVVSIPCPIKNSAVNTLLSVALVATGSASCSVNVEGHSLVTP